LTHYKNAIVTGGASGLGLGIVAALAQRSVSVTTCDVKEEVHDLPEQFGSHVNALVADVGEPASAEKVVSSATAHAGQVDLLINNVGNNPATPLDASLMELADAFDRAMRTNTRAALLFSRAVLPSMRDADGGHILNISTDHIHTCGWPAPQPHEGIAEDCPWRDDERPPWGGRSWITIYDMSKWALNGLTQVWARSLASENIRVNSFCPGSIDSPRIRARFGDNLPPWHQTWMPIELIVGIILELLDESPGRTGDNVGLWCGHPAKLPEPGPQALVIGEAGEVRRAPAAGVTSVVGPR
jgi:NAD(P)-dependent dehydrogenase (short-subunit alcohol dehydrogenase family)